MKFLGFVFITMFLAACSPEFSTLKDFNTTPTEDTVYLVMGGGFAPHGAQGVLELNMRLFDKTAETFGIDNVTRLFGGGNDQKIMDVTIQDDNFSEDDKMFAFLWNNNCPQCDLRHNELKNLDGDLRRETVVNWLDVAAEELQEDDSLRIYYTGHGDYERNPDRFDENFLGLWHSHLSVQDFSRKLDLLPEETQTQIIMVQCFSGGFAQINYVGGELDKKKISPANRCGFFSQVADETASGCSADLNRREEYSPYFFAAFSGMNGEGQTVEADYNGDGKVTSDEAHAYVIISENAKDVPITTSSQLLREQEGLKISARMKQASWRELTSDLNANEQVIVNELSKQLKTDFASKQSPFLFIERQVEYVDSQLKVANEVTNQINEAVNKILTNIRKDIESYYPIFVNIYGKNQSRNFVMDSETLAAAKNMMLEHVDYPVLTSVYKNGQDASENALEWERKRAKWRRLEYVLKTKLLEKIMAKESSDEVKNKYKQLKACEASSFFKE